MGVRRRTLLVGFAIALFLGVAVYFRLWSIESAFSADDREILRRQFDRANMDAMDESAEWRMKYDEEVEKSRQYQEELLKVKDTFTNANERLNILKKVNADLQKQVLSLTQKVEAKQQHCNCNQSAARVR